MRFIKFIFLLTVLPANFCFAQTIQPLPQFEKEDRVLFFAPHPDDESIATGGLIQEAAARGLPLKVVYFTNGDNNQLAFIVYKKRLVLRKKAFVLMGEVRRKEAIKAMNLLA
ncbi:MAG: PIG-L family deacetylase [Candidatus Omnitrophica bacterium]|nr:PIG-L family deacetylase [Candidatus Omnitrophota bacterium]